MRTIVTVLLAIVLAALMQLSVSVHAFKFKKCGGNNDLDVRSVGIEPDVMRLPGRIAVSFSGAITRPFNNMDMRLTIKRKTVLGSITIPCLFNLGSCNYPNLCTLLDRMIEENWAGVGRRLAQEIRQLIDSVDIAEANSCPFKPASVDVSDSVLDLPALPSVLVSVASGTYDVKVELTNRDTKVLISCFEMEIQLERGD